MARLYQTVQSTSSSITKVAFSFAYTTLLLHCPENIFFYNSYLRICTRSKGLIIIIVYDANVVTTVSFRRYIGLRRLGVSTIYNINFDKDSLQQTYRRQVDIISKFIESAENRFEHARRRR